jgi:hypothetical protein
LDAAGTAYQLHAVSPVAHVAIIGAIVPDEGHVAIQMAFDNVEHLEVTPEPGTGSRYTLATSWDVALRLATLVQILLLQARHRTERADPLRFQRSGPARFEISGGRARSPMTFAWDANLPGIALRRVEESEGGGLSLIIQEEPAIDLALSILDHVAQNGLMGPVTGNRNRS